MTSLGNVMADIFVSYKSEDRERARLVARALQDEGFDVWWDPALQAGEDYQEVIDLNLRQALVVVVLWSPLSVKSRWVRSEATIGDRYGALAPCMIEQCDLPTAFVLVQTVDLSHWHGDRADAKWREFADEVAAKRERRRALRVANAPVAAAPDAMAIESLFWQTIKDSSEAADFRSYLKRYPQGHFQELARNRLATLGSALPARSLSMESNKTKRAMPLIILLTSFAALLAVGAGVAFFVYGSIERGLSSFLSGSVTPESPTPIDLAINARQFDGKWGADGLGCEFPMVIVASGARLGFADGSSETVQGVEPDGAVRTKNERDETFFYKIEAGKMVIRSAAGATASYVPCAS